MNRLAITGASSATLLASGPGSSSTRPAVRLARRIGLAVLFGITLASGALAQQADAGRARQMGAELQKRFTAADTNGDGKLTKDEAKNGMPFVYKPFDEIDTGKTGAITIGAGPFTGTVAAQPAARGTIEAAGVRKLADLPYGQSAKQRIDVYLPPGGTSPPGGAPILVMVHGGAWMFGDKSSRGVVGEKLAHWVAHGWILVSVNNRLLPEADPRAQAEDVARAVALVQQRAASWGGDSGRLVLMGHSAGAHLVALLSAAPALAAQSGAARWAGTVVLDGAALDVARLMSEPHPRFYDRVFGADAVAWRAASPAEQLSADAVPMLVVCSTLRLDDSCGQAERFVARVAAAGVRASVHKEALPHNGIDVELGRPGAYTDAVDAFIAGVLAPRN